MENVTYEQAQEAKNTLIKYLVERIGYQEVVEFRENRRHTESLVLLALTQDYFLD